MHLVRHSQARPQRVRISGSSGHTINAVAAPDALKGLPEKPPVWPAAYGDYALGDESRVTWYQHRAKRKNLRWAAMGRAVGLRRAPRVSGGVRIGCSGPRRADHH